MKKWIIEQLECSAIVLGIFGALIGWEMFWLWLFNLI